MSDTVKVTITATKTIVVKKDIEISDAHFNEIELVENNPRLSTNQYEEKMYELVHNYLDVINDYVDDFGFKNVDVRKKGD